MRSLLEAAPVIEHKSTDPAYRLKMGVGRHIATVDGQEQDFVGGELVHSAIDLVKRFPEKFEYVKPEAFIVPKGMKLVPDDGQPSPPKAGAIPANGGKSSAQPLYTPASLAALTVSGLQAIAEEEEVDVKGSKDKAELVKILTARLCPPAAASPSK